MTSAEQTQEQYYTKTAHAYDSMHDGEPEHQVAFQYIKGMTEGTTSVLDVGSGTGRVVKWFQEYYPDVQVVGIEPVRALLTQAEANGIGIASLVCGSGAVLPFEDNSFDVVTEFAVLHHVADPNQLVREMTRVARKAIFISDSNRFGQGRPAARVIKLLLYKLGLWGLANFIMTKGRRYRISEGDGLFYSYSVFDSYETIAAWANRIILIPIDNYKSQSWFTPLLTSTHVLVCAFKEDRP